jgi:23S rRNA (adenine2503-C2)-methyltransferase
MGFKRNLTTHEILDQIRQINILRIIPKKLSCISFMGMGEPFDNIENCMKAVDWINSNYGYKIGREKITFSTSGSLPFEKFLSYDKLPNLAVSIHFTDDKKRRKYMKGAKIPLPKLKQYMMEYCKKTGKQISVEYCLIDSINDGDDDLDGLVIFLKGLKSKVNLLNYNKTINSGFMPADENRIIYFKNQLKNHRIPVIYRKSLGKNIDAGCGQLGIQQSVLKDK